MTPQEWWRIYEVKRPRDPSTDYAGSLSADDVARLRKGLGQSREEALRG